MATSPNPPDMLRQIVDRTRQTIAADRRRHSIEDLQTHPDFNRPTRGFADALSTGPNVNVIAEIKRASPSAGLIRRDFDPPSIARAYQAGGASCLSVLTDEPFFQGSLDFLIAARQAVELPVLRKDFIVDDYQIVQARAAGADAVLLIAECLPGDSLDDLYRHARSLGMDVLMELYDPSNLDRVLDTGCRLVGINNRDLTTFKVDLNHTVAVAGEIQSRGLATDRIVVGESGIHTAEDVRRLADGGAGAILVGESLMRQNDIASATRAIATVRRHAPTRS